MRNQGATALRERPRDRVFKVCVRRREEVE